MLAWSTTKVTKLRTHAGICKRPFLDPHLTKYHSKIRRHPSYCYVRFTVLGHRMDENYFEWMSTWAGFQGLWLTWRRLVDWYIWISRENDHESWRYLCGCRVLRNFYSAIWAKCWRIWCFDQRKSRMSEKDADRVPKFLPNEVKKDPPPLGEIYDNVSCFIRLLIVHEPFDVLKQQRF